METQSATNDEVRMTDVVWEEPGKVSRHKRPSEILKRGFIGTFCKGEIEAAAEKLITFFAEEKGDLWTPFTLQEIVRFYEAKGWNPTTAFCGLMGIWYDDSMAAFLSYDHWRDPFPAIALGDDKLLVTDLFVKRASLGKE